MVIIKYNIELLNRIIKNIFNLTGITISVLDTKYNILAKYAYDNDYCSVLHETKTETFRCRECDNIILKKCKDSKELEKHLCFAGLYDAAMPIIKKDNIVGYALMGRVKSVNSPALSYIPPHTDVETAKKLETLYSKLPFITEDKLKALYDLLSFVVFDNAIQIVYDSHITEIINFIDENFHKNLTINFLCSKFHISRNRLYTAFSDNLDCTVNMYITECRLNSAKALLSQSDKTVYQIAQDVGVVNYTYFCKLFKKHMGYTPAEYRKKYTKSDDTQKRDIQTDVSLIPSTP